jgi:hypothetical protein
LDPADSRRRDFSVLYEQPRADPLAIGEWSTIMTLSAYDVPTWRIGRPVMSFVRVSATALALAAIVSAATATARDWSYVTTLNNRTAIAVSNATIVRSGDQASAAFRFADIQRAGFPKAWAAVKANCSDRTLAVQPIAEPGSFDTARLQAASLNSEFTTAAPSNVAAGLLKILCPGSQMTSYDRIAGPVTVLDTGLLPPAGSR